MTAADSQIQQLRRLGERQWIYENSVINLIASDNAYPLVQAEEPTYCGHMLQEGLRHRRPFAGAVLHDEIELFAEKLACEVFGADHANLQPHSCSQANQAAYHALLTHGDAVLALGFRAGGHLTHGLSINFSGRSYRFTFYGVDKDGLIDYGAARDLAISTRPKLIVCGSSSYPRLFDAPLLRAIADEVDSLLMFDLSHEAGLIAGGVIDNPVPLADVVTMSLDKTLRGPFGGLILARKHLADAIDRAVHPGTQSSFPIRKLTDAAHALALTKTAWFRDYARNVLANAKVLERHFFHAGIPMVTGGTDKHYIVLDVKNGFGLVGQDAERRLEQIDILTNRQTLPQDPSSRTAAAGGLRLGTAWVTSRGYRANDIDGVAELICSALTAETLDSCLAELKARTAALVAVERVNDVWRRHPGVHDEARPTH